MTYSESFKSEMVARMMGPTARSATSLAEETGVAQTTLSRWLVQARRVRGSMSNANNGSDKSDRRTQEWTAAEKLRVVMESAKLSDDELGAFLRREGLHEMRHWLLSIALAA
jgi:transposase